MPKLVVLSEGLTGRTHELKAERTTVGRVEDNSFQVPDPSVSSHHCEIILKGSEVHVRDLGSTNGTFISGERISESVLKPSQILRLGQVDVRLEGDTPTATTQKRVFDHTQIVPQGIKPTELDTTARATPAKKDFQPKSNKPIIIFIVVASILALALIAVLVYIVGGMGGSGGG
jgi:pSer/pThr/pTyr-binding forkhead associated (FHA) protein